MKVKSRGGLFHSLFIKTSSYGEEVICNTTNNVQILSSTSDDVVSIDLVVILYRKNNLPSHNFVAVELS